MRSHRSDTTTAGCLCVARLKDPVRVARRGVDFVPPAQPHEPPARDVFQVVEVQGEEEECDDEDEDEVADEEDAEDCGWGLVDVKRWAGMSLNWMDEVIGREFEWEREAYGT